MHPPIFFRKILANPIVCSGIDSAPGSNNQLDPATLPAGRLSQTGSDDFHVVQNFAFDFEGEGSGNDVANLVFTAYTALVKSYGIAFSPDPLDYFASRR